MKRITNLDFPINDVQFLCTKLMRMCKKVGSKHKITVAVGDQKSEPKESIRFRET